ncbi:MAG: hypothetical protein HRU15_03005 [Planctomycetes bacterium]|nr:hypothetical protein [Planctomycetota bacterium]
MRRCLLTFILTCVIYAPLIAAGLPQGLIAGDTILAFEVRQESADRWQLLHHDKAVFIGGEMGCRYKRLQMLKEKHGTGRMNMSCKTMGGKQYWADVFVLDGWRIQYHVWTEHFRLLNTHDVRCAWGSYESCRTVLQAKRLAQKLPIKSRTDVVVLLHGIIRSKDSLQKIEDHFTAQGVEVININYASCKRTLAESAKNIHYLFNQRSDIQRISFVTHSMGGLLLRELMRDEQQAWRQRCILDSAVLIFPPNQGAHKANIWHDRWWYKCVLGPAGQELRSDHAQELPQLPMKVGIIAGCAENEKGRSRIIPGDDDGTVGIEETRLSCAQDYAYHKVGHTFGANDPAVIRNIDYFFQYGKFKQQKTATPKIDLSDTVAKKM